MEKLFSILLLAFLIDRLIGDPYWLWPHLLHPVVFFSWIVNWFEAIGNRIDFNLQKRYLYGWIAIMVLLVGAAGVGWLLAEICLYWRMAGLFVEAVIVSLFFAQKNLSDHVITVCRALEEAGIEQGGVPLFR
ncbi:MAG: adenosylcobinamide-phosphate synthase [Candidatus Tokpelaia sp. JSC189]|nr:MAG: adenosylcobinamide-phosphate synthase [Candidatus Tokpelaia sp. JSC189]